MLLLTLGQVWNAVRRGLCKVLDGSTLGTDVGVAASGQLDRRNWGLWSRMKIQHVSNWQEVDFSVLE